MRRNHPLLIYYRALMRAAIGTGFNPYDNHAEAMAVVYIVTAPAPDVLSRLLRPQAA